MAEEEISVRIRRNTYNILMKHGEKSIKDAIDKLLKCSRTHVIQSVIGRVTAGNSELWKRTYKENDYVIMLCTMDSNERYVDIALTEKQATDLMELLQFELKLLRK